MERTPLAVHFVWIGSRLPYFARLAVESALVALPDAVVHVHYVGRAATGEHAAAVAGYPRVHIDAGPLGHHFDGCPPDRRQLGDVAARVPNGSAAAISNLVRLAVLWRHGGIYLDTDVLVLRGLHDPAEFGAYVGRESVWAANRTRVEGRFGVADALGSAPWALRWLARRGDVRLLGGRLGLSDRMPERAARLQVNNAVLAAPARSRFVAEALGRACHVDAARRFALGPSLLDDLLGDEPALARVVPPSRFYAVPPGQSYRLFEDAHLELPADAQVIHYVASNHRRLLAALGPDDVRRNAGHPAAFWRHAAAVRDGVAAGRAATGMPALMRRAG